MLHRFLLPICTSDIGGKIVSSWCSNSGPVTHQTSIWLLPKSLSMSQITLWIKYRTKMNTGMRSTMNLRRKITWSIYLVTRCRNENNSIMLRKQVLIINAEQTQIRTTLCSNKCYKISSLLSKFKISERRGWWPTLHQWQQILAIPKIKTLMSRKVLQINIMYWFRDDRMIESFLILKRFQAEKQNGKYQMYTSQANFKNIKYWLI